MNRRNRQRQRNDERRNAEVAAMSSVQRAHCHRKQRHRTFEKAGRAAERLQVETGMIFRAYRCQFCEYFHIGRRREGGQYVKVTAGVE